MRDFEPGFHEPPWGEEPDFREGRFPRNPEEFERVDRRPFEGRWGPPPDWDRRSPPFAAERYTFLLGFSFLLITSVVD